MTRTILYTVCATMLFFACRKDDNPKIPELTRVPVPTVVRDVTTADKVIPPLDPASFAGKFTVGLFFDRDVQPQKFDVVIRKNEDQGKIVTFKENITTFPTTLDITGQDLTTLFGGEVPQSGDKFDIGVDITTQDGQKFLAFPSVGRNYGTSVGNQAGALPTEIRYSVPCPFDATLYQGDFEVISDEWEDYAPGDVITVTSLNENQISFEYATDNPEPIVLDINLATNDITAARQPYGDYGGTKVWAEALPDDASVADPCDVSLSVKISHSGEDGSSFGTGTFVLRKK